MRVPCCLMAWVARVCERQRCADRTQDILKTLVDHGLEGPEMFDGVQPYQLVSLGLPLKLATAIIDAAAQQKRELAVPAACSSGSSLKTLLQERVLQECRTLLSASEDKQMLMSMLLIALSRPARQSLPQKSLYNFLARFPDEFQLSGSRSSARVAWAEQTQKTRSGLNIPRYGPGHRKDSILIDGVIVPELENRRERGDGPWPLRDMAEVLQAELEELTQEAFEDADVTELPEFIEKWRSRVKFICEDGELLVALCMAPKVRPPTPPPSFPPPPPPGVQHRRTRHCHPENGACAPPLPPPALPPAFAGPWDIGAR
eukprot:TRINITY_DN114642_c0_g1_i1.p1 TRINITY_DN114642_c0_g1~~TRINITY_DN114642_c0_g1_i1.p1  ORF type:complete len:316 (+),score=57.34 TRINITY_DN114642_c0_g1_i1:21-968(+)